MNAVLKAEPLYFDDVFVGAEYVSSSRRVSELDLRMFTEVSGDRHPIHTDPGFARTMKFGEPILQGPFRVALAVGLFGEYTEAANALTDNSAWRFLVPASVGDELSLRMRIASKRLTGSGSRGIVKRHARLVNQNGIEVQERTMGLMMWCHRTDQ